MTKEEITICKMYLEEMGKDKDCNEYKLLMQMLEQPTSDDCVSRAEVIRLAEQGQVQGFEWQIQKLETLPPITPTQRWIPCSERLPEDRNIVLVTAYWHETYQVMMASYFGEGLWWCVPFNNCGDHMQKLNPKAWQPLPKPYKEMRGSENEVD